jgi:uncharacterized membrane-anchored protein YhcB (DUF1043 family)
MVSFLLGIAVGVIAIIILGSGKTVKEINYTEEIDELTKRKQELQEQQIDDFSRMMSYDVDVAYDRKSEV